MNNTTYTANQNCFLIDGEVCLTETQNGCSKGDILYDEKLNEIYTAIDVSTCLVKYVHKITHSTNKELDNVVLLPRDKFVKPKITKEDIARKYYEKTGLSSMASKPIIEFTITELGNTINYDEAVFIALCSSNYGMFDDEEHAEKYVKDCLLNLPLSLPASVEINEQGEIVNTQWT